MPEDRQNKKVPDPRFINKFGPNGLPTFTALHQHVIEEGTILPPPSHRFRRYAKWVILIGLALFVYFRYFGYWDIANHCRISVYPSWSQLNNHTIIQGITYLKDKYPDQYQALCQRVDSVNPNMSCGGSGGGCYSAFGIYPKRIDVSTLPGDIKATAGVLAHETCHASQFYEKRPFNEKECYDTSDMIIYGQLRH